MEAKATGISASTNRENFYCGVCHDGNKLFNEKPTFAACSDAAAAASSNDRQCGHCHSTGKQAVRKCGYKKFTTRFPKGILRCKLGHSGEIWGHQPDRFCGRCLRQKGAHEKPRGFCRQSRIIVVSPS